MAELSRYCIAEKLHGRVVEIDTSAMSENQITQWKEQFEKRLDKKKTRESSMLGYECLSRHMRFHFRHECTLDAAYSWFKRNAKPIPLREHFRIMDPCVVAQKKKVAIPTSDPVHGRTLTVEAQG